MFLLYYSYLVIKFSYIYFFSWLFFLFYFILLLFLLLFLKNFLKGEALEILINFKLYFNFVATLFSQISENLRTIKC